MISTQDFLYFSIPLFAIGLLIAMSKKNTIMILIGIEFMLNATMLNFVAFSKFDADRSGEVFFLFILVLAAISLALALAIIIQVYKSFKTINPDQLDGLNK